MAAPPDDPVTARTHRRRVVILLVFVGLIVALIYGFRAVLMPFLVALFVSYLLAPLVDRLAPLRIFRSIRLGRPGAVIALYIVFVFVVYFAGSLAIPALGRQIRQVREDLPRAAAWAEEQSLLLGQQWAEFMGEGESSDESDSGEEDDGEEVPATPGEEDDGEEVPAAPTRVDKRFHLEGGGLIEGTVVAEEDDQTVIRLGHGLHIVERSDVEYAETLESGGNAKGQAFDLKLLIRRNANRLLNHVDAVLGVAFQFGVSLVRGVYLVVLILMITAFILIDRVKILSFLHSVYPQRYRNIGEKLALYIDRGLAGVIRGQLTICAVNGVLTWVGLELLGVRYAGLLGLIAGIFSLIPIFGTIISTIPIVLIAWGTGGFYQGMLALAWILLIHFIEANMLNPKIMGDASKIHPVVVIFALLAGEHAYGLVGALLAVPTASIIQSSFRFYVIDRQDEADGEPATATG
jgi:predicted PurR-regulated permease PerM